MCGRAEQSSVSSGSQCQDGVVSDSQGDALSESVDRNDSSVEDVNASLCLLELAADNDVEGFKRVVEQGIVKIDVVGNWYTRQNGTAQMVLEERTPAMIAALYGSLDVLEYILSLYPSFGGDINQSCGNDGSTALHCAAAGGSMQAAEVAKLLCESGADLDARDVHGRRPADVIAKLTRHAHVKVALERILRVEKPPSMIELLPPSDSEFYIDDGEDMLNGLNLSSGAHALLASSLPGSVSHTHVPSPFSSPSPSSSPKSLDTASIKVFGEVMEKVKEYPIDPSIPDIKSSVYSTDEFRMFSFKVRPCSRAYSHDWTECPFVHPGENARRRDPRRYHYSCVPCPDFRKGVCRRGDTCEYAHGVFECWLHPAQYRTRLCKDGTGCTRRVCFFAHTTEELRPLYVSTGSAVPSPRGTAPLDMAAMSPPRAPGSPSSILMMSPFSSSNMVHNGTHGSLATPPMSPSSPSAGPWSPGSVPALHLPGTNLHGSRLRAELNARDLSLEDLGAAAEFDGQLNEFSSFPSQALSTQARLNAAMAASSCGVTSSRSGKYGNLGLSVAPTNLDELFASEVGSSPRAMLHESALSAQLEAQLLAYKSSRLQSQLQNELHNSQCGSRGLSPISDHLQLQLDHAAMDSQLQEAAFLQSPRQAASFSLGSLARMSARGGFEADRLGAGGPALSPSLVAARAAFAQRDKRSHSSRDLGIAPRLNDWGSPTGKPEWGVQGDDSKFKRSASFGLRRTDEPEFSWVQRDSDASPRRSGDSDGSKRESDLSVLESWIDNMRLDQIVA